jgi:thioesterase domain-containing protein/acyl carrier protein
MDNAPPSDPFRRRPGLEHKLMEIWSRVLGVAPIDPRASFSDLGGDSLAAAEILAAVEDEWGVRLPLTALLGAPTVTALAGAIRRHPAHSAWSTVVALQPRGDRPPFFCVHGVGGEVLGFADLARHLAPEQPFYGLRAVGRDGDGYEPSAGAIEAMAARYVEAVRDVQPDGPYRLGGFSFGGSVALEMAQQLHARGERVALLAILDHTPPPLRFRRVAWTPARLAEFAANAARWLAEEIGHAGRGRRLAALRRVLRKARRRLLGAAGRRAPSTGWSDVEEVLGGERVPECFGRVMAAHYQALRDYRPRPYPGRVTLFRARTRPLFRLHGWDLGWGALAGGGLEVVAIPGNHETLLREPRVRVLATALKERLRGVARGDDAGRRRQGEPGGLAAVLPGPGLPPGSKAGP